MKKETDIPHLVELKREYHRLQPRAKSAYPPTERNSLSLEFLEWLHQQPANLHTDR